LLDVTGVDVVSIFVLAVELEVGVVTVELVVYLVEPVVVVLRLLVLPALVVNEGVPSVVVSSVWDIIILFDVSVLLDGTEVTELEVE